MRIPLKWTYDYTSTFTTGVGNQIAFFANSISDPGGSAAATQPYGYDQLATLYGRYRVLAAAIEVETQIASTGNVTQANVPYEVTVWPSRSTTSFVSDPMGAAQQPYGKNVMFGNANSQAVDKYIRNYMSTAKIFGVDQRAVASDDLYAAVITTDPTAQWYWNVMLGCLGAGTNTILFRVVIIQYVEVYGRLSLSST